MSVNPSEVCEHGRAERSACPVCSDPDVRAVCEILAAAGFTAKSYVVQCVVEAMRERHGLSPPSDTYLTTNGCAHTSGEDWCYPCSTRMARAIDLFRAWADGYLHTMTGVYTEPHIEVGPLLSPSAAKRMMEICDGKEEVQP